MVPFLTKTKLTVGWKLWGAGSKINDSFTCVRSTMKEGLGGVNTNVPKKKLRTLLRGKQADAIHQRDASRKRIKRDHS